MSTPTSASSTSTVAPVVVLTGRPCSICHDERRPQIDAALASSSFRGVARRYSISAEALRRHAHRHVLGPARAELERSGRLGALTLGQQLLDDLEVMADLRIDAVQSGRPGEARRATLAHARLLESVARLLGLGPGQVTEELRDAGDLVEAFVTIAHDHPDLALALAHQLDNQGAHHLARAVRNGDPR